MTLEQTRQLGIEFERRVQTMIPETEFVAKLDTETIYSYLNQYQDKYIHEIYRSLDNIPSGTKLSAHIESVLQSMLTSVTLKASEAEDNTEGAIPDPNGLTIIDTARSITYTLPKDFYMYLRSVSNVTETFSFKSDRQYATSSIRVIPNMLMSQSDVWKLIETPHDSLRILRYPAAVLNQYKGENPTISVIYDRYTKVEGIKLMYYKQPHYFDIMTSTPCELPMDAFDDIVTGAVDLYVQYVAGAEARKRQLQQQAQQQQRKRNKEDDE